MKKEEEKTRSGKKREKCAINELRINYSFWLHFIFIVPL